jgi:hypothetical protein
VGGSDRQEQGGRGEEGRQPVSCGLHPSLRDIVWNAIDLLTVSTGFESSRGRRMEVKKVNTVSLSPKVNAEWRQRGGKSKSGRRVS